MQVHNVHDRQYLIFSCDRHNHILYGKWGADIHLDPDRSEIFANFEDDSTLFETDAGSREIAYVSLADNYSAISDQDIENWSTLLRYPEWGGKVSNDWIRCSYRKQLYSSLFCKYASGWSLIGAINSYVIVAYGEGIVPDEFEFVAAPGLTNEDDMY